MTLNNTLNIGVSGILSQSIKIGSVSDNIANVNTVGYKGFSTDFLSLVQAYSHSVYDTLSGARPNTYQNNSRQGQITSSDNATDIAVNGNGLFVVSRDTIKSNDLLFTRQGTFSPDLNGNMRNSGGFYLQGWKLDSKGELPPGLAAGYSSAAAFSNLTLVNVTSQDSMSVPTSKVDIRANLDADQKLYNPVGNISFAGNPVAGDSITINGVPWTFVVSGATGNQTNIGQTLDATLTQFTKDLGLSASPAIKQATYSNIGGSQIKIVYDSTNGPSANFTFSSSSINATPTQLLAYNPTSPLSNMSSGAISSQFNRGATIVDNNGVEHSVKINFLKTAVNTWDVEISSSPANGITTPGGQVAYGQMTFNGDGTLHTISPSLTSAINFPWSSTGIVPAGSTTATTDSSVTINWGTAGEIFGTPGGTIFGKSDGMRQVASDFIVNSLTQDGHATGSLQRVEVADNGIVSGIYSNGVTQALYKIPLAKFINPDGMDNLSGTVFGDSETAGFINLFASGQGGVGNIKSGAVESSNVELATELTNIIIAQRAYQSNTKTISTTDEMFQTITDMVK